MRSHLAIGALGVLAMGVVPVAAKPQTTPSGLTPPTSDICAFVQNELKVTLPGLPGKVAVGFISVSAFRPLRPPDIHSSMRLRCLRVRFHHSRYSPDERCRYRGKALTNAV